MAFNLNVEASLSQNDWKQGTIIVFGEGETRTCMTCVMHTYEYMMYVFTMYICSGTVFCLNV